MKKTSEEIKNETKALYRSLEECCCKKEKQNIYNQIFETNKFIIVKRITDIQKHQDPAFFSQIVDDLYGELSLTLWECILNYNPNSKAGLYTYSDTFMKAAENKIINDNFFHGVLSDYYINVYKQMSKIVTEASLADEPISLEMFEAKIKNFSIKTLEAIYQRVYSLMNHIPVKNLEFSNEYNSSLFTDAMFMNKLNEEEINTFLSTLSDLEKKMFELLDSEDSSSYNYIHRRMPEITLNEVKRLKAAVQRKARNFYFENYNIPCKICAQCTIPEEKKAYYCLNCLKNLMGWDVKVKKPEMEESEIFTPEETIKAGIEEIQISETPSGDIKFEKHNDINTKIELGVELGIQDFIKLKVEERLNEMTIPEITQSVIDIIKNRK